MAGRLYRMAKVVSANPKSWGIVDANEISGFKRVAKLSDLYSIAECILSSSYGDGVTDGVDAVGQIWHVSETDSDYKLTNWANRKSAAGWTKLSYGGLDTTVYKVLGTNEALPTTGIKSCIYLKLIETGNPTGDNNKYAEYVYTGDIAGTYDATKWEKLGEVTSNIDLSEYYKKTDVYNKSEINEKTSRIDVQMLKLNNKVDNNAITIDAAMSETSTNAVQNKVIDNAIKTHKINSDNLDGNLPGTDGTEYNILGQNSENGNVSPLTASLVYHYNPITHSYLSIDGLTVWDDASLTALTDNELNEILV